MRIRSKRGYGYIEDNQGNYSSSSFSKGTAVEGRLQYQYFKPNKSLKVDDSEVRNPTTINNNKKHDYNFVGRTDPNEDQSDHDPHKAPPVGGKGLWTYSEDACLRSLVNAFGDKKWSEIAKAFPSKSGKQCRERWHNHLRPDINEKPWTEEEERDLIEAHSQYGNKWVQIAQWIPGRTENAIKNHWNTNKRKNSRKNAVHRRPRPRTRLQEYIARVDRNEEERTIAPRRNARPNKVPAVPEKQMMECTGFNVNQRRMSVAGERMDYTSFNLNQPEMSTEAEEEQIGYFGFCLSQPGMAEEIAYESEKLFQSVMKEAEAEMERARAKPQPPGGPEIMYGGEMFYTNANSNLTPYQLHALNSDEVSLDGSFTELLLGVNVDNTHCAEYVPPGRYVLSHNIGPVHFGEDIGSSSSYSMPSEPTDQDHYKNMAMMGSEKTNFVDVKGKGKMRFAGGDYLANFFNVKGKGKMFFPGSYDL